MPELYSRTLPSAPASKWDFSWQPQVVVVNLGTNDFSTDGDPSQAELIGAYQAFLTDLRAANPHAYILCLVPTLLAGTDLSTAQSYIEQAVAARQAAGDASSLDTHAAMGAALTKKLQSVLGWEPARP